jgi:hypothetical protein
MIVAVDNILARMAALEHNLKKLEDRNETRDGKLNCMDTKITVLQQKMDSVYHLGWITLGAFVLAFVGVIFAFFVRVP